MSPDRGRWHGRADRAGTDEVGLGALAEGRQEAVVLAGAGRQHDVARLDAVQRDRGEVRAEAVGEADAPDPDAPGVHRIASENAAIALAERGVRSSVVRLAPSVHGLGDYGFVPTLIGIARDKGVSAMVGDGANRWPAVHRLDAARLFRLAVEAAPAGARLHGAADEGVPFRDIAAVIGRHLNVPVAGVSRDEADAHFGWLAAMASADNPTSSASTRELLGWRPAHPALITDLDDGHYFHDLDRRVH